MKTKILYLWELLQTSFWFIPLIIMILGVGTSFGLIYIDSVVAYNPSGFFLYFFSGGVEAARSILSTIAGAMLGVAGTVFSMTLVALTLASSQFGSRMLRNFMHDRLNQIVLGAYLATFIFCLLVLRTVKAENEIDFVPNISILFAIVVAVANIFLLIAFIHHISVSIQADQVISDISSSLDKRIKSLFPDELGAEHEEESEEEGERRAKELKISLSGSDTVSSNRSGYLQAIDNDTLIRIAKDSGLLLTLDYRPGDFIVDKLALIRVNSKNECDNDTKKKLQSTFIIGDQRNPIQDPEFAIHQMVEIAARALSPGVNDPYTAITCIDKLTSSICYLTHAHFPSAYRYDEEGNLRVVAKPLTFAGIMDAGFNMIRQYGSGSPSICIRLMDSFIMIKTLARNKLQVETIERHAKMVYAAAELSRPGTEDLSDIKERYVALQSR